MEARKVVVLLACACVAGCMPHFKAQDSYGMMFHEAPNRNAVGDPYTFGGIGDASGGLVPTTDWADVPHVFGVPMLNLRNSSSGDTLEHGGAPTATDHMSTPSGGVEPAAPSGSTQETGQ